MKYSSSSYEPSEVAQFDTPTHKKICMLNKGSENLNNILNMRGTEKTKVGLG